MKRRISCLLLAVVMMITLLPWTVMTANASSYTTDWRRWSQGASTISEMGLGCRVVAQAKLITESGAAPAGFTPDTLYYWMKKNNGFGVGINENFTTQSGEKMMEYLKSLGVTISREATVNLSKLSASERKQRLLNYIKDGCYIILDAPGHQTYVSRKDTLARNKVVISDSGGSVKQGPVFYYEGYQRTGNVECIVGGWWSEANFTTAYVYRIGTVNRAAKPTITTSGYEGGVKVTLACSTSGATIYYTTNDTTPTTSSTRYTGAFNLTSGKTVRAIAVVSGKSNSQEASSKITVNKAKAPTVKAEASAKGYQVTMTAESGASIYYTLDGTAPTIGSARYAGPLTITENATIKAVAVKKGTALSDTATVQCTATVPGAPTVSRDAATADRIGIGEPILVRWNAVNSAYEYEYTVTRDGETVLTETTQANAASIPTDAAGSYAITVRAVNFLGKGEPSAPPVTVQVMADVRVTFADHDGTVLSEQVIRYNTDAQVPSAPSRTGYTFSRWQGSYLAVKQDVTVTALYVPNTYTVRFVDESGITLYSELVDYDQAVSRVPEAPAKTGFVFAAWSVKSGEGTSYTQVNGNVVFEPTYVWENPDMPLGVAVTRALRTSDAKGYEVTAKITSVASEPVTAKVITAIKTSTDKTVATKIDFVQIPANAVDYEIRALVGGTAVGSLAEIYVVGNDPVNSNRTGGALSARAFAAVTVENNSTVTYWGEWSDWSAEPVTDSETREVETKTQYAYSDEETTTSTSSSLAGWTKTGSYVNYGAWGSWSSWSTTKQTASDTKSVETRTAYVYQHYCDGNGNIAPSSSYSYGVYGPHTLYYTSKQAVSRNSSTGYTITDGLTKCAKGSGSYYYMGTTTQYRYRTRTATTYYTYSRWTDWSDWSDTVYSETATRRVQTRTVYRYRDLITQTTTGSEPFLGEEDNEGTVYAVSGKLDNLAVNYGGKNATVMVYKDRNVDPTEDQMEYIGQIRLGAGNAYAFTFVPKEEISLETGNYIVSLGIATANGLVNFVDRIEAPKPSFTVVFKDTAGTTVSTQTVELGSDAVAPELEEIEGYQVSWDRSFTNITRDTIVRAVAAPKVYPVVFVDWENNKIVSLTQMTYGEELTFPADCSAVGKRFVGWSVPAGSLVSGTMVVEAKYEDELMTVIFLNRDGSTYQTQKVPYGSAAALPEEDPVSEGYTFVAWSNETFWWNVTDHTVVHPIFVYSQTVENPMEVSGEIQSVNLVSASVELQSATEGAVIRYTLDGSEPAESSQAYPADGISLEHSAQVKARAFKANMNASDTVTLDVEVIPAEDLPMVEAQPGSSMQKVETNSATLAGSVQNPKGYPMIACGVILVSDTGEASAVSERTLTESRSDQAMDFTAAIGGLKGGTTYTYVLYAEFETVGTMYAETGTFTTKPAVNPFSDVKSTDYFFNAVLWAMANNITSGTSTTTFGPNLVCTRSQVVTFLWRAAGQPEPQSTANTFSDVKPSDFYYKAVLWAVEQGITSGVGGGKFGSLNPCTRSQVVTFLWRAAGQPEPQSSTNPFSDVKSSDYFYKAVLWAVETNVTSGVGGGRFGALVDCTRSQVVTFLWRAAGQP